MLNKQSQMVLKSTTIHGGNMVIRAKQPVKEFVIDLNGPEGNAFCLMGYARRFAGQLGLDSRKITQEMMSGDYENLLKVFDRYFGEFVILEK